MKVIKDESGTGRGSRRDTRIVWSSGRRLERLRQTDESWWETQVTFFDVRRSTR